MQVQGRVELGLRWSLGGKRRERSKAPGLGRWHEQRPLNRNELTGLRVERKMMNEVSGPSVFEG